jgi:hypothetical protein
MSGRRFGGLYLRQRHQEQFGHLCNLGEPAFTCQTKLLGGADSFARSAP